MEYAEFWERLVAHIIDNLITMGVMILAIVVFVLGMGATTLFFPLGVMVVLMAFGVYFGYLFYNFVYLVNKKGASLGKKAMGLRIVDKKNKNIEMGPAFIRFLVKDLCFLFSIFGALAYIIPIFANKTKQSLGDMAAGSFVVLAKKKK